MAGDASALFQRGVRAIRDDRDLVQGRQLLIESLRSDPNNDDAWVWLSQTVTDPRKKLDCLDRALTLNPDNLEALTAKRRLENGTPSSINKRSTQEIFDSPAPAKKSTQTATAARVTDLGRVIMQVGLSKGRLGMKIFYLLLTLGISIACFYGWRTYVPTPTRAGTYDNIPTFLLIGAIVPLFGVLAFAYSIIMTLGTQVVIHENGLHRTQGGDDKKWRWEDFSAQRVAEKTFTYRYHGIPVYRMHTYDCRLLIDNKVMVNLNHDLQKYREMGNYVTQKLTPILFERNYKAHRNGETTYYGKVEMSRDGIRDGRRSLPWDDIGSWSVDNGTLIIKKSDGGKFRLKILDLPNAFVLMAMIEKIKAKSY